MGLLLLFLVGLVLGVLGEQVWHRTRTSAYRPGRRRRLVLGSVATVGVLVIVAVMGSYAYAQRQFDKIEKVPVGSELSGGGAANYLLVGTDNRAGVEGNRSDTILLLRLAGSKSSLMSIPRDLFVAIPGRDGQHRINTAYNGTADIPGPKLLVRTVQQSLGIPIDRYIEINFASFAGVVDAIGGVSINFPHPASDPKSGLDIKTAGNVQLDGAQALAYVRSRTFTEVIGGRTTIDGSGDLGRVQRQQAFLRAVLGKAGRSKNPFRMAKIGRALTGGLKVDDKMTVLDGVRFAWRMGRLKPATVVLPTTPTTTSGGAQVLLLKQPDAGPILAQFKG